MVWARKKHQSKIAVTTGFMASLLEGECFKIKSPFVGFLKGEKDKITQVKVEVNRSLMIDRRKKQPSAEGRTHGVFE